MNFKTPALRLSEDGKYFEDDYAKIIKIFPCQSFTQTQTQHYRSLLPSQISPE